MLFRSCPRATNLRLPPRVTRSDRWRRRCAGCPCAPRRPFERQPLAAETRGRGLRRPLPVTTKPISSRCDAPSLLAVMIRRDGAERKKRRRGMAELPARLRLTNAASRCGVHASRRLPAVRLDTILVEVRWQAVVDDRTMLLSPGRIGPIEIPDLTTSIHQCIAQNEDASADCSRIGSFEDYQVVGHGQDLQGPMSAEPRHATRVRSK